MQSLELLFSRFQDALQPSRSDTRKTEIKNQVTFLALCNTFGQDRTFVDALKEAPFHRLAVATPFAGKDAMDNPCSHAISELRKYGH